MKTPQRGFKKGKQKMTKRQVMEIELLAIDLSTCTRCLGTLDNIKKAIVIVTPVFQSQGIELKAVERLIETEQEAILHKFVSSPTIRINGKDIVFETRESRCDSCSDLCGCGGGTDCRIWHYQGEEHTEAPVGLIVESLLREFNDGPRPHSLAEFKGVPENLRAFFAGRSASAGSCCSAVEQDSCCEPEEKSQCCPAPPVSCGCR